MIEQIDLARRYARMLWRYRWVALLLSTVVSGVGWAYVISMPNTYEVKAEVYVDTYSMLRPLLKGLALDSHSLNNSLALIKRTLLTRPGLEEVARRTDLDLKATNDREFDAIITSLSNRISLSRARRDNVFVIKFVDPDPNRAKKVVDELLDTFLEKALGSSRTDTQFTQRFLSEQIAEYEKRLIEAEERLKDFKQRNVGMMPGAQDDYFRRLESQNAKLKEAKLALQEARKRRDELRKQLGTGEDDEGGGPVRRNDPALLAMSPYTARIEALRKQLDQLEMQYTDKHPDIITLHATVEELEARREAELDELAETLAAQRATSGRASAGGMAGPALAVAEAEAVVAALEARVAAYARQAEELARLVDTVPEIEAELKRLDRDYAMNKRRFEELLERRESARMSEDVDARADDVKLKVIEPPRMPLSPSGPNRPKYFAIVFLVALGAGGALAFLLSQIQPRFYTVAEVKAFTQLPMLGSVSYQGTPRYRRERRMELAVFLLIFLLLAGAFTTLVTLERINVDLHGKYKAIAERIA